MGMLIALCLTGVSHASMQRHALHVTEVSSRPAVTHSHANTGKSVGSGKRVSAHACMRKAIMSDEWACVQKEINK